MTRRVTIFAAAIVLAGCGGSDGPTAPGSTPNPRDVAEAITRACGSAEAEWVVPRTANGFTKSWIVKCYGQKSLRSVKDHW